MKYKSVFQRDNAISTYNGDTFAFNKVSHHYYGRRDIKKNEPLWERTSSSWSPTFGGIFSLILPILGVFVFFMVIGSLYNSNNIYVIDFESLLRSFVNVPLIDLSKLNFTSQYVSDIPVLNYLAGVFDFVVFLVLCVVNLISVAFHFLRLLVGF